MTPLQQRFLDAIEKYIALEGSQYDDAIKAAIACEKIADEFAAEFGEWCAEKYIWMNGNKIARKWMKKGSYSAESFITAQLIQQFKEQSK